MISINNEPMIDMMKVIDHKFIEDHNGKIRIESSKNSIIVKYIRDPNCSIRDIIIVFNGDGVVEISGLYINGTYASRQQFDVYMFESHPNLFRTILNKNFFGVE